MSQLRQYVGLSKGERTIGHILASLHDFHKVVELH